VVAKKPDFVCVVAKLIGYLEYDCKPGVVCDYKKLLGYLEYDCKPE
jgi:hypothetical protein